MELEHHSIGTKDIQPGSPAGNNMPLVQVIKRFRLGGGAGGFKKLFAVPIHPTDQVDGFKVWKRGI